MSEPKDDRKSISQQVQIKIWSREKVFFFHRNDFVTPEPKIDYFSGKVVEQPSVFEKLLEFCEATEKEMSSGIVVLTFVKARFGK